MILSITTPSRLIVASRGAVFIMAITLAVACDRKETNAQTAGVSATPNGPQPAPLPTPSQPQKAEATYASASDLAQLYEKVRTLRTHARQLIADDAGLQDSWKRKNAEVIAIVTKQYRFISNVYGDTPANTALLGKYPDAVEAEGASKVRQYVDAIKKHAETCAALQVKVASLADRARDATQRTNVPVAELEEMSRANVVVSEAYDELIEQRKSIANEVDRGYTALRQFATDKGEEFSKKVAAQNPG